MNYPELRKQIITLADLPKSDSPTVSAYFDLTQPITHLSQNFAEWRAQMAVTFDHECGWDFEQSCDRIQTWLLSEMSQAKGAAFFSREGDGSFFLPILFQVQVEKGFYVGHRPAIFPLVELKDRFNRFVVVLTTQLSARIMEINLGETSLELLTERPTIRKRHGREWTREHYINHRRDRDRKFLKEKVEVIEHLMAKRGHNALILAGEARFVNLLREALPAHLRHKVVDELRTGVNDKRIHVVLENAIQSYLDVEQRESESTVKQLFGALRTSGLATLGVASSLHALRKGQADQLVVSSSLAHSDREQLVRLASSHGIAIETVRGSELLDEQGGAGVMLRYRNTPRPTRSTVDQAA